MKILILGAGRVGYSVVDSLASERNDITVIDTDAERLRDLESRFDVRGVVGSAADAQVLAEAGAQDTDLLVACTALDETNLVACKIGHLLYHIPTRVARLRTHDFEAEAEAVLLGKDGFAVDRVISPEKSITRYIARLIEYPEALQVREFAGGHACLVSVRARAGAALVGASIGEMRTNHPTLAIRLVAIYRRYADEPDRLVSCDAATRVEPGDEVFVLAAREQLAEVLTGLHCPSGTPAPPVRRIMIAGAGNVALGLARQLAGQDSGFHTKIIDPRADECTRIASLVPGDTLVLHGDATDEDLLSSENVEEVDLFLALSDDDEDNIMASMLAKRMGAKRVLALIHRRVYADLMHGTQIDIALSPAQTMLGELLAYVRQGDVPAVHSLRRGVAEALEIVARGDRKTSRVVGRCVGDLRLPAAVHMGLIVRGLPEGVAAESAHDNGTVEVIIPRSHTVIESGDHVVFFVPNKRLVREVEKLFRVSATFF